MDSYQYMEANGSVFFACSDGSPPDTDWHEHDPFPKNPSQVHTTGLVVGTSRPCGMLDKKYWLEKVKSGLITAPADVHLTIYDLEAEVNPLLEEFLPPLPKPKLKKVKSCPSLAKPLFTNIKLGPFLSNDCKYYYYLCKDVDDKYHVVLS